MGHFAHTPAPWRAIGEANAPAGYREICVLYPGFAPHIKIISRDVIDYTSDYKTQIAQRAAADAQLIAAAPSTVEDVRCALSVLRGIDDPDSEDAEKLRLARQILADALDRAGVRA